MKNGTVCYRTRQISAEAAIGQHDHIQPGDATRIVKTHGVVVRKRMAFASDQKVIVPVQPQLDRALEFVRCHGCPHGHVPGLRFLAAKTASHAAALHSHCVVVKAQGMRHPVLHLAGVLRA